MDVDFLVFVVVVEAFDDEEVFGVFFEVDELFLKSFVEG